MQELSGTDRMAALGTLDLNDCEGLKGVPDSINLPALTAGDLSCCESLKELTCSGLVAAVRYLRLDGCRSRKAESDKSNFPQCYLEQR